MHFYNSASRILKYRMQRSTLKMEKEPPLSQILCKLAFSPDCVNQKLDIMKNYNRITIGF